MYLGVHHIFVRAPLHRGRGGFTRPRSQQLSEQLTNPMHTNIQVNEDKKRSSIYEHGNRATGDVWHQSSYIHDALAAIAGIGQQLRPHRRPLPAISNQHLTEYSAVLNDLSPPPQLGPTSLHRAIHLSDPSTPTAQLRRRWASAPEPSPARKTRTSTSYL